MSVFYRWVFVAVSVLAVVDSSSDLHLFHVQCECIYRDNKLADLSWQDAYDGTTVMYYDTAGKTFVAVQPIARAEVDRRNSNTDYTESVPRLIEGLCDKIKQTAGTSNFTLEKMAPTFTRTFIEKKAGRSNLVCLVKGFSPSDIKVSWARNGVTVNGSEITNILPQRDGTFQARSILTLSGDVDASYSCQVEHETITGKLIVLLERNRIAENEALIIVGAVLGILGISAAVVTGILYCCILNRGNQFSVHPTAKFTNRAGPCGVNPCNASVRSNTSNSSNSSSTSADGLTKSHA
ncbi:SLA class II histocompatibility antigen, DQ haplotype C beta chain-like [Heterodontus francisci]|uniref:SLA class II histocompatibility antigen, DQ haplotype C beta chain-like n=1 Tax=Heterodontus francisci TaxID=7792 RepID=UPI00355BF36C